MSAKAAILVSAAAAVDLAVVSWVLFSPAGARVDFARVARAAVVAFVLVGAEMFGALFVARSYFLAIHVAYVALMVVVPVAGILVLAATRKREVTPSARTIGLASLLLVPIGVDATFIEPFRLVTESTEVPIARERELTAPLSIAVLSDIQTIEVTDHERDAVARAMAAKPDLILLTGDLQQVGFDHQDEIIPQLRELLAPLHAPLGAWYCEGNTESSFDARRLLQGTPVKVLENDVVSLAHAGARVTLGSVDLMFASPRALDALHRMENAAGSADVRILFAHRPDVVYGLVANTRVDLVVSGHTHGGQVQLPFLGPPITLSNVPREVAAGGLHDMEGRRVYVSRGIGWEHGHAPRVRFLCPPEVSLLTLKSIR